MAGRKPVKKEGKPKKKCVGDCKRELLIETNFYNSSSKFHADGRLPICKDCLEDMIDVYDVSTLHNVLRQIDKPYIHDVWESCKERDGNAIRNYFRQINSLHQYKEKTWEDSVFPKGYNSGEKPIKQYVPQVDFKVSPELVVKWGSNYTPEEYMRLEQFYEDMQRSYEIETASHVDYLKKICRVSLKMDEALDNDDVDSYKKLSDSYDKLMHSAKFTAVQRSASDRSGGMNTFSEFYEFMEKEGFIAKWHNDEPMDIVDATLENLKKFTRSLVLGDSNLANLVEESLKKMQNNEDEIDVDEEDDLDVEEDYEYDGDEDGES